MSLNLTVMSLDFDSFTGPRVNKFTKNEVTIGRMPNNDLVLNAPDVSAQHARLRIVDNAFNGQTKLFINDLGSTNGTHIGSVRLASHIDIAVAPNERIRIGNFLIKPTIIPDDSTMEKPAETKVKETEKKRDTSLNLTAPGNGAARRARVVDDESVEVPSVELKAEEEKEREPEMKAEPKSEVKREAKSPPVEAKAPVQRQEGRCAVISGRVGMSDVLNLDFVAQKLVSLSGKVLHHGKPLAGVKIQGGALGVMETDAEGCFRFADIVEGAKYALVASKGGFIFQTSTAEGVLSEDATVVFSATQLFSIKGRIMHHGKPLVGVEVDGGTLGKTITDEHGVYVFKEIPEDTEYTLRVHKEGYAINSTKVAV